MRRFQQEFYDRYEDREIPLMHALDPDLGIGYPSNHNNSASSPLVDDLVLPKNMASYEQNRSSIQSILFTKMRDKNTKEIVLTDNDVKELKENWSDLPPTIATMFQVIRSTTNDHLIKLKSCGGYGANLLSRFAHTDDNIAQLIKDITDKEKEISKNVILAEIAHLPQNRVGNILCRPHLRDYELLYMSDSDLEEDRILRLSDLTLSIKQGRLVIHSKKLKKEIVPCLTNAHNYHNGSMPVYRFLCDMQTQTGRNGLLVDLGKQLEQGASFIPRIRYKNTILSSATWFIKRDDIKAFFTVTDDKQLVELVTLWRDKILLPRYVLMSDNDNELYIDWENPISIRSLFSIIKRRQLLRLIEFLFEPEHNMINSEYGNHTNECICIFYKNEYNEKASKNLYPWQ